MPFSHRFLADERANISATPDIWDFMDAVNAKGPAQVLLHADGRNYSPHFHFPNFLQVW